MQAREFCRQDVAPPHSELATALKGLPADTELALLGAFAFHQRVCNIPHRASERQLAETQLQWWRTQLTVDAHSTHPSLQALATLRAREPAISHALQDMLDTVAADIDFAGFAEQAELDNFLQQRGQALIAIVSAALDVAVTAEQAKAMGGFLEYCQLAQEFSRHANADVVYLPYSELSKQGFSAEQLCHSTDANLAPLFAVQTAHQRSVLRAALNSLDAGSARKLSPLMILLTLRNHWLAATEADGYRLQRYRLQLGALQRWHIRLNTRLKLATGRFSV